MPRRFVIINGTKHSVPDRLPPFAIKRGDVEYVPFTKPLRNLSTVLTRCKLSKRDRQRKNWEWLPNGRTSLQLKIYKAEPTVAELKAELARRGLA